MGADVELQSCCFRQSLHYIIYMFPYCFITEIFLQFINEKYFV